MRICVLGGTGFVGSELVIRLAGEGHWVRVPTRLLARGKHLTVLPTVELLVANVHDPRVLAELFSGMDVVVNLVGILNERGRSGAGFRAAHTELAAKVAETARTARVARLLHVSALGADAEHAPSHYLRSKGQAERHVRAAAGFAPYTIFRPSVIFGPADSLTQRFARLLYWTRGFLPLARPHARFAPIYVEDVADAMVRALHERRALNRTYELCGPDVLTLEQIVRITAAAAGAPCRILRLPDALARLQGLVMDFVPGKPFSSDNYRSLTVDSLCREDGCAQLGIRPQHLAAIVPTYLGMGSMRARRERYRRGPASGLGASGM